MGSLLSKVTSNEPEVTKVTNDPSPEDQSEKKIDHHEEVKPDQKLEEKQDCSKSHRTESIPEEQSKIFTTEMKVEEPSKISSAEPTVTESVKSPEVEPRPKESHSECPGKDDDKVIETAEEAKPESERDVSLMTEACQAPIPVTPYVENRYSACTKDRENLLTDVLMSGKIFSTNLESSTNEETKKHIVVDEPSHEQAEMKSTSEVKHLEQQMPTECVMGEDTTETKDLVADHEMAVPVEKLADQLSNVVISTAAEELLSDRSGLGCSEESKVTDDKKKEFEVEELINQSDVSPVEGFVKVHEHNENKDNMAGETGHESCDVKHQDYKVDDINAEEHRDTSNEVVASN